MTRFNDSATDTLEYVAEHGVKFTWSDFKVVQTNESAYYVWNPTSKTYMWSGTPTFSYRLDIDKNVRDIVFVNEGTLPDIFIMNDEVHGAVDYNANMASQSFDLDIYCPRKDINLIYLSNVDNTYLTINNVDFKEKRALSFCLQYNENHPVICESDLEYGSIDYLISISSYGGKWFSIKNENTESLLLYGILALKIVPVFDDMAITGKQLAIGAL